MDEQRYKELEQVLDFGMLKFYSKIDCVIPSERCKYSHICFKYNYRLPLPVLNEEEDGFVEDKFQIRTLKLPLIFTLIYN